jgi:DUF4097 and DUF4098 domain-containing protein YvlB
MTRYLWLVPTLALSAWGQTTSAITREEGYWVETVTGTLAVEGNLRVETSGPARIQGEDRGGVAYVLKRRAKAPDQAAAKALLDRIVIHQTRHGPATVFEVTVPDARRTWAALEMRVPKQLREVAVASRSGTLQLFDLAGDAAADTAGGAVEIDRVKGAVTVRTGGGTVQLGKIGGNVECYTAAGTITAGFIGGEAGLNTGGGEIVVHEAKGLVRAKTLGGSIRIERADRGVQVAAGSGLINIVQAGGPVTAETGSGSIKVRSASNVRCESGAGTIQLQAVSGGLQAATGSGSILADLTGAKLLKDSTLATTMGDITVLIPSNLPVTVVAVNASPGGQRIISDFAEIRPQLEHGNSGSAAQGAINGGGPVLRLTASNGTIYLRRQK